MKLARSAPVVVVLLLLASGGTASAECAWVLWEEVIVVVPDHDAMSKRLGIVGTGQTPQDCGSLANGVVVNTAEWLCPLGQVTADGN